MYQLIVKIILVIPVLFFSSTLFSQQKPPYKDSSLSIDARVRDLLSRMTPEEKFWQLFMIPGELPKGKEDQYKHGIFGFQVSAQGNTVNASGQLLNYNVSDDALTLAKKINSIQRYFIEKTRLGIPIIAFDEALHGLVREGATAFPQAIGLAASFDTALMARVATAIAAETKARGIRQILTPVVNIASDVRWGRTEETYGEDPYLSSEMGVAFVKPFEQNGIITTPKHFLANVGDGGRDSYPIHFNERFLEEIHLPPFRACIERGGSRSVMTSYNSIDGSPATASDWLLNKKLKDEWNFTGFVISDASAVGGANVLHFTAPDYPEAGQRAITNGLDVIFQTAWEHHKLFIPPFLNGQIDTKRIDDAVSRVLRAKFELGLFENPYVDEADAARVQMKQHRQLSQEAASKSFVLLKNSNRALPLSKNIRSIAVIGADAAEARLGGYSGPGNNKVSILQGITEYAGKNAKVNYAQGPGREIKNWTVIPSTALSTNSGGKTQAGLTGQYFDNLTFHGKPVVVRTDHQVNFHWTLFSPDPSLPTDHYAVRWTGKLKSPKTGKYKIGLDGNDGFRLFINGKLLIDTWVKHSYSTKLVEYDFKNDTQYDIRIDFHESQGNAHCRLIWDQDLQDEVDELITQAVAATKQSDVAVIVAGIEEGEFRDRAMLSLPGKQEELILKVAATGTPVVVLLSGGSAITMDKWLDSVNAVLNIWYPGEVGGHAVARTLFGDENPAGRLPVTYPKHEAQLPLVYNHKPTGRGDDYNNLTGLPLFPFGYGLSYTNFQYSNIKLHKQSIRAGDSVIVQCLVSNTGDRDGDEVVQLYIRDLLSSVARPVLELKGFQRIHLRKGQARDVSFTITPSMLSMLNEKMETVIEPGDFRIMIGSSSRDLKLKSTLKVE